MRSTESIAILSVDKCDNSIFNWIVIAKVKFIVMSLIIFAIKIGDWPIYDLVLCYIRKRDKFQKQKWEPYSHSSSWHWQLFWPPSIAIEVLIINVNKKLKAEMLFATSKNVSYQIYFRHWHILLVDKAEIFNDLNKNYSVSRWKLSQSQSPGNILHHIRHHFTKWT